MEKNEVIHTEKKESFYKDLFKLNQEIILLINPDTFKIEECNQKACSYYGYTYNEMLTFKITHFNNLPEDQVLKEIMLAKTQQRNRFYFKHRLSSGEIRDVEVHATPVTLEGGDMLFSIVTDTTDSKIVNNRLREENILLEKTVAERTYRLEELNASLLKAKSDLDHEIKFSEALFESIPGYLYVYDEAGKLIKWNKKHEEMTGYTSEELSEMTMDQWFEGEDSARVAKAVTEVLSTGYGEVEAELLIKGGEKLLIRSNGVRLIMDGKTYFTGVGIDVTERNKLQTIIVNEKNLLETTLKSVGDGVISCDNDSNVVFLNTVAEGLTGWTQEMARGESIEKVFNIINEFTRIKSENIVKKVIKTKKINELANHTILISKDGTERPIEDSAAPIMGEDGEIFGVVLVFRDFSEKKQKQDEIEFLSYHDQLTGLTNRRFYEERLKRLDKESNLPIALIMADVNGLKLTNDAFGHQAGDLLLQKFSAILKKECGVLGIVSRIGGDEFVLLLPRSNKIQASKLIERINEAIENEKIDTVILSIAIGFAVKTNVLEKMDEIFKDAEDDMYRHKLAESSSMRSKTIELIMNSLYEKNEREMRHSQRVSEICKAIASKMDFTKEEINQIGAAGLIHDIGKIGISDAVLNKNGKLNPEEWHEIKRHSEIGYRILSSSNEFSKIADYILGHHERWDGNGYPKGLKEEEIAIEARIIAVADAFDAMTSERTYGEIIGDDEAVKEIKNCSGAQFDPDISKVFIEKVLGKDWQSF